MRKHEFDTAEEFLGKFRELIQAGIQRDRMQLYYPHPVHGLDQILDPAPSPLRYFTFSGAITGLLGGFAFTVYTILSWPLNSSGKPLVSIPAFIIVAFELTILFGAVISFIGFLLLSRLPSVPKIFDPDEFGNKYVIIVDSEEVS